MADMKLTPEDKKDMAERYTVGGEQEDYPCGLEIRLSDTELEKLGNPQLIVGEQVVVMARAVVESLGEEQVNGDTERRACLQITEMEIKPAAPARRAEDVLYSQGGGNG